MCPSPVGATSGQAAAVFLKGLGQFALSAHFLCPSQSGHISSSWSNIFQFLISSRLANVTAPSVQCICANSKSEVDELREPTEDLLKEANGATLLLEHSPGVPASARLCPSSAWAAGLLWKDCWIPFLPQTPSETKGWLKPRMQTPHHLDMYLMINIFLGWAHVSSSHGQNPARASRREKEMKAGTVPFFWWSLICPWNPQPRLLHPMFCFTCLSVFDSFSNFCAYYFPLVLFLSPSLYIKRKHSTSVICIYVYFFLYKTSVWINTVKSSLVLCIVIENNTNV